MLELELERLVVESRGLAASPYMSQDRCAMSSWIVQRFVSAEVVISCNIPVLRPPPDTWIPPPSSFEPSLEQNIFGGHILFRQHSSNRHFGSRVEGLYPQVGSFGSLHTGEPLRKMNR